MKSIFNYLQILAGTAAAILFIATVSACDDEETGYSPEITHEVNESIDFKTFKTFSVINPLNENIENPPPEKLIDIMDDLIAEIKKQMNSLGLTENTTNPDLKISPFIRSNEKTTPVIFYDYFYGYYWGYEYTWTIDVDYTMGTLILDVVAIGDAADTTDDILVFRGTVEGIMGQDTEIIKLQLRNSVDAIFKGWPSP
jgi:hypothetical protein